MKFAKLIEIGDDQVLIRIVDNGPGEDQYIMYYDTMMRDGFGIQASDFKKMTLDQACSRLESITNDNVGMFYLRARAEYSQMRTKEINQSCDQSQKHRRRSSTR